MKCETSDGIALLKADTFKDKQQMWRDPPMKNTLKTTMLLATMGALIMFISSFWGSGGLTIGLFLALAMVGGSYWMSDKLAIRSARAIEVEEGQLPEYWTIMKELCQLSGQPMPRIYAVRPATQRFRNRPQSEQRSRLYHRRAHATFGVERN